MGYAIEGAENIPEACAETVRKYWNAFMAGWHRANPDSPEIPAPVSRSVTNGYSFEILSQSTQAANVCIVHQDGVGGRDWTERP